MEQMQNSDEIVKIQNALNEMTLERNVLDQLYGELIRTNFQLRKNIENGNALVEFLKTIKDGFEKTCQEQAVRIDDLLNEIKLLKANQITDNIVNDG